MATIEPTAVAAGVTINLNYDKDDIDDVETELDKSSYADSLVFVAWEHDELDQLVVNLIHDNGGDSSVVPAWNDDDYDSIFVVTITRGSGQNAVVFSHDQEGLGGQSTSCAPVPRPIRYFLPANSISPP
jgi:biotin-(acetyl-CoA carboxylase) ligase